MSWWKYRGEKLVFNGVKVPNGEYEGVKVIVWWCYGIKRWIWRSESYRLMVLWYQMVKLQEWKLVFGAINEFSMKILEEKLVFSGVKVSNSKYNQRKVIV